MCFGKLRSEKIPDAYRIDRLDDPATPGHHYRTRTSIERHIATAPLPLPQPKGQRYPKPFEDKEGQFPKDRGQLYQYPTKAYAYGALQDKDGNCPVPYTGDEVRVVGPGYTRTITTASKQVVGVTYHPAGDQLDWEYESDDWRDLFHTPEVHSSFDSASTSTTKIMSPLNFEFDEPFGSDLEANYFSLINAFLQPDSQASVQDVANEILEISPQKDPNQETRSKLTSVAAEMASQIPYTHPSMSRLGNLIAQVFNSRRDIQDPPDFSMVRPFSQGVRILTIELKIGQLKASRYDGFQGEVREIVGERFGFQGYINYNAFLAHVYSGIWRDPPCPRLAMWELRVALEDPPDDDLEQRDRYAMSAAQWILIYGDAIFEIMGDSEDAEDDWYPLPTSHGRPSKKGISKLVDSVIARMKKQTKRDRWDFWRDGFEELASNKELEEKEPAHAQEMRKLCHDAAQRMGEVEKGI